MPLVNIYFAEEVDSKFADLMPQLKTFIAEQLSCDDKKLISAEISVRLLGVRGRGMIASIELEISAHSFSERVQKQDEICNAVRAFIKEKTGIDSRVWLQLSELGHSW